MANSASIRQLADGENRYLRQTPKRKSQYQIDPIPTKR